MLHSESLILYLSARRATSILLKLLKGMHRAMQNTSSFWTKVLFLHEGDSYFQEIENAINNAKEEVLIETYIFELDGLTQSLLNALVRFQRRGGRVQILVDGFGTYFWIETLQKFCADNFLEFRVYRPLPRSTKWFRKVWLDVFFKLFFLLRKLNRRNHRKTVVIDRKTAFIGSFNWTMVHSKKWMGEKAWRDSGLLLEGYPVEILRTVFMSTWMRARQSLFKNISIGTKSLISWSRLSDQRRVPLRVNTRKRDKLGLSRDLLKRFKKAEKRIWIASAYFLPKRSFLRALRRAARRGVDVQIIWPGPTDVPLVKLAAQRIMVSLLQAGAQVFEYQPCVLHAKYLIIDDWCCLGSSNFNHRSYFHDLEIEAEFDEPQYVLELMNQCKKDRELSRIIQMKELQNLPFWQKFISLIAYRLRYLL